MEKQVVIKHLGDNIEEKINDIMECLNVFVLPNAFIECIFSLHESDYEFLDEIKELKVQKLVKTSQKRQLTNHKECLNIKLTISFEKMVEFLRVVEKYGLNILVSYKQIKVFLNDNDGDFIIVDSNDESYRKIKNRKWERQETVQNHWKKTGDCGVSSGEN